MNFKKDFPSVWTILIFKAGGNHMSRLHTMARFEESIPEPKIVGECEECGAEFYEGSEVIKWEGMLFCDKFCLVDNLDCQLTVLE